MRTLAEPPTYSIASFPAPSPQVNNLTFLLSLTDMSAKAIADRFLSRLSGSVSTRTQLIDANQAMKLACTLNRRIAADVEINTEPPKGTPLPPGWHLVYFTPSFNEDSLGLDGSDRSYNPDRPFTRRMWAGGRLHWPSSTPSSNSSSTPHLRIGDTITEKTRLVRAEPKANKSGREMIVAGVEKTYEDTDGQKLLTDQREWVFLPELDPAARKATSAQPAEAPIKPSIPKRHETTSKIIAEIKHKQSAISLFRFSALTFNAHQIHYSLPWCRDIEGHPYIVVHAPLNLVLMLELFRSHYGSDKLPNSFQYRAVNPIYANEEYSIKLAESGETWIEKGDDGKLCMTGRFE